jgi:ribonuclease J
VELPATIHDTDPSTVHVLPLGGCGEFGMNIKAIVHQKKLYILDCGIMFPQEYQLGIEAIIPDVREVFSKFDGVAGYIITHGHEDHIGALPYIYRRYPAPIYATAWTRSLIESKFLGRGIELQKGHLNTVTSKQTVRFDGISFEYIQVNHSIPMACALVIEAGDTRIFHTGDFKFDFDPIGEPPFDTDHLDAIGKKGINLCFIDSTNAHAPGMCPSEASVYEPLKSVVRSGKGASIITTFASNLWRILVVFKIAKELNRAIGIIGQGFLKTLELGHKHGLIQDSPNIIVDQDLIWKTPHENLILLCTGSQGEIGSGLHRISHREYKYFKIAAGDQVIFSSRIIPGNERSIITTSDRLAEQGATIINTRNSPGIHCSGHAHQGDIELLLKHLKPNQVLPVHGTHLQLLANFNLSQPYIKQVTTPHLIKNGTIMRINKNDITAAGEIETSVLYIDQGNYSEIEQITLKERLKIGELGMIIAHGAIKSKNNQWVMEPYIGLQGIGILDADTRNECISTLSELYKTTVSECFAKNIFDADEVSENIRIQLRKHMSTYVGRKVVTHVNFTIV